jgi:succinate dehydrogenase/fumarate reductase-like Fe-S protein
MKLQNPFSEQTRNLFLYVFYCFKCGRSDQGLELHHITGRDSDSPFNACVLCTACHSHIGHTPEEEKELFMYTQIFLKAENYIADTRDHIFITNHIYLIK